MNNTIIKRNSSLAKRLQEVLLDGRWIANTNYKEQLLSINWQQAIQQIDNLNTIAALTFHINYYLEGLLQVFNGGKLEIKDEFSFDLPPLKNENDWNNLLSTFLSNAEKFIAKIEEMKDEQLDQVFVEEKYGTYLRNIEGVIEHSYYHLGQVSLLKKMIINGMVK